MVGLCQGKKYYNYEHLIGQCETENLFRLFICTFKTLIPPRDKIAAVYLTTI